MTEEERQPLVIHANPHWDSAIRLQPESSGEYNQIIPQASGVRHNHGFVRSISSAPSQRAESAHNRSQPKKRKTACNHTLGGACGTILACVALERFAFYGLSGNLVLFLNKSPFLWESYHAMNALFLLFGIAYVMSLFSGWLADGLLGRFKTLLIAFIIYFCGMTLMPFIASTSEVTPVNLTRRFPAICASQDSSLTPVTNPNIGPFDESCAWLIYITLIVIAIGCGSMKANICPFGSDQLAGEAPRVQFSFFNWYYWCVNFGSILSFGVVAYIEQEKGFQTGYIICTIALGCSFFVFISGRCFYKIRSPDGSILTNIVLIIRNAWHVKRLRKREQRLNDRIAECPNMHEVATSTDNIGFLDHAKHRYGGIFHASLVDDVKKLKVILAVFSVSILYWLVYFQMQTTFMFQGLHMKLHMSGNNTPVDVYPCNRTKSGGSTTTGKSSFVLVVAWFSLFDGCVVIILLPLFDRIIYPYLDKKGYYFTFTKRIVLGMMFALAAMVTAGVVEHFRLQAYWPYPDKPCVSHVINQEIGHSIYNAADMTAFWQIPQYVLIGVSEVFASVACLQFAVSVAPKSMKALVTGLYYLFMGIGSFIGTAIISILSDSRTWFYDENYGNINCRIPCECGKPLTQVDHSCHLDYYFYLLAGLELVGILLFLLISYRCGLSRLEDLIINPRAAAERRGQTSNGNVQKHEIGPAS